MLLKPLRSPKFVVGALAGGAAMYYFDPAKGRSRRARHRDQWTAELRRLRRRREQRGRDEQNRLEGQRLADRGAGQFHPVDDIAVAQHLKQVLAATSAKTIDVVVDVVDGVATLRGEVPSEHDRAIVIEAVRTAPGISGVESYLHLPGEPAPNKAAALAASDASTR